MDSYYVYNIPMQKGSLKELLEFQPKGLTLHMMGNYLMELIETVEQHSALQKSWCISEQLASSSSSGAPEAPRVFLNSKYLFSHSCEQMATTLPSTMMPGHSVL